MSVIFVSNRFVNDEGDPDFSYFYAKASASAGENTFLFNLGAPLTKTDDDLSIAFSGFHDFCSWRPLRYFLSSLCLLIHLHRQPYDKVVFFSPVILTGGLFASLIPARSSLEFFLFDFFPFDNFKVKGLKFGYFYRLLYILESSALKKASKVTVMHSSIVARARDYFSIPNSVTVDHSYLASSRSFRSLSFVSSNRDRLTFIFSGHLSPGRGIEKLVHSFNSAVVNGASVKLYVCGNGPFSSYVSGPGVEYLGSHNKDSVSNLVHSLGCVAGIVSLHCDELLSCFPSKSLDYLSMGIPIISISSFAHGLSHDIDRFEIGINLNWDDLVKFLCNEDSFDRLYATLPNVEPYYSTFIYKEN